METVLRNVSAGVISLDKDGVVRTINRAAEKMFDIKVEKVINRRYEEVLIPEHLELVDEFINEIRSNKTDFIEKHIELTLKNRALSVLMTTTVIKDDDGKEIGMVAVGEDGAVFQECTQTIISQVEVLKNLVNEFSRYARMPVANPTLNDLHDVIGEAMALFQEAHKDVDFSFQGGEDMPKLNFDGEQLKRVMINLLDNAVAAVAGKEGVIAVTASYDRRYRKAKVEVADNGCGVPAGYKMKMFDPYFSTKKSGTGLGLAIVSSIISDHRGHISVRDNPAGGTIVAFELPTREGKEINGER
jgi:two-component system nitrogen regulation sensor histidine kinase NtrY